MELIDDPMAMNGYIELHFEGPAGSRLVVVKNLIVKLGRNLVAKFLTGDSVTGAEYLALGTGTAVPAESDTQLGVEGFRKAHTQRQTELDTTAKLTTYLTLTDANGTWNELGLFGNGATGTPGSGTLIARAVTTFTKGPTETLTVVWRIPLYLRT